MGGSFRDSAETYRENVVCVVRRIVRYLRIVNRENLSSKHQSKSETGLFFGVSSSEKVGEYKLALLVGKGCSGI